MKGLHFFRFLIIGICFNAAYSQNITEVIDTGNGLGRGYWGPVALCPSGSYAAEFELKYEPWGSVDVTLGNAVKLYCVDMESGVFVGYVTSLEGTQGTWQGIRSCPPGVFIKGYTMDVTPEQGPFGDNVGVGDVRMFCEDNTQLDGLTPTTIKESKPEDGANTKNKMKFKNLRYTLTKEDRERLRKNKNANLNTIPQDYAFPVACQPGTLVCGLETLVEDSSPATDDAGLCNLILFCCE